MGLSANTSPVVEFAINLFKSVFSRAFTSCGGRGGGKKRSASLYCWTSKAKYLWFAALALADHKCVKGFSYQILFCNKINFYCLYINLHTGSYNALFTLPFLTWRLKMCRCSWFDRKSILSVFFCMKHWSHSLSWLLDAEGHCWLETWSVLKSHSCPAILYILQIHFLLFSLFHCERHINGKMIVSFMEIDKLVPSADKWTKRFLFFTLHI